MSSAACSYPQSLLVSGAMLVNVFSGEIYPADVLCRGEAVAAVGAPGTLAVPAGGVYLDARGTYLLPGLINGHVHIESSLVTPARYAEAVLPRGTTAVVADPHEIANVAGLSGIRQLMAASLGTGVDFRFTAPSCVPASPFETAGAQLGPDEVAALLAEPAVVALGEVMNYPGVLAGDPVVLAKIAAAGAAGKPVDGHAPGLTGASLARYVAAGVRSDHECASLDEAAEKLRLGMWVMIRQGSAARNLEALLPLARRARGERLMLVTDDRHPDDLLRCGELDQVLREAVAGGVEPLAAVRMATLNPAQYFGLADRGLVAPGRLADLWLVRDLAGFESVAVVKNGRLVWHEGSWTAAARDTPPVGQPLAWPQSVHLPDDVAAKLRLPPAAGTARVIGALDGQLWTRALQWPAVVHAGGSVSSPDGELARLAVIERHGRTGGAGLGLVHGLGLGSGGAAATGCAIGSTVAHDSHNIILAGTGDRDMLAAAETLRVMRGGCVVVRGGRPVAELPLPVAGLMSDQPLACVAQALERLNLATRSLGTTLSSPFMTLSFLALPVIPELKLTDCGLVDVGGWRHVSLWL